MDGGSWKSTVTVSSAEDLRAELDRRRETAEPERSVWVTDLVDPRTAYYQRIAPVPITPERRRRMEAGRELHAGLETLLAPPRHREVRVRRRGVVGQIDIWESRPIELKSTSSIPDVADLPTARPQYIEQLAMYCTLVGRPEGRLILARPLDGAPPEIAVFDVTFTDTDGAWAEIERRADDLRSAFERRDPSSLPACDWRGRGCPFESARACACSGTESPPRRSLVDHVERLNRNPMEAETIAHQFAQGPPAPAPVRRFRELLYPRRTYFDRVRPPLAEVAPAGPSLPPPDDLYREISDLLESGTPGEVTREPSAGGFPEEPVMAFRGTPYLLKISRSWNRSSPSELLERQPQYFLELGFRCAAVGQGEGLLLIGYTRAERWPDRLDAFRVRFTPLDRWATLVEEGTTAIRSALERSDATALPPCPGWMFDGCDYREVCGCGAPSGRR